MRISRTVANQTVEAYAATLFEAAAADGAVDRVDADLRQVVQVVRAHAELRDALTDDGLPLQARVAVVRDVFADVHPAVLPAVSLVVEMDQVVLLSSISERFSEIAEERRDTVVVEVTTAVALTDTVRDSIMRKLAVDFGKKAVLREKVDPAIIGGIRISAAGRAIDASVLTQLENARVTLSTAHTGGEV